MRRRRTLALLASLLFSFGLASYCSAVPILVELKIADTTGSLDTSTTTSTTTGKGGGGGKKGTSSGGTSTGSTTTATGDLSSLTLWLSTDGKSWQKVSGDLVAYSLDQITAQISLKGTGYATDLFGSGSAGSPSQTYYIGLSTSSKSFSGVSARVVSWQFITKTSTTTAIPAPAMWPLFATGALGLGIFLRGRKKR